MNCFIFTKIWKLWQCHGRYGFFNLLPSTLWAHRAFKNHAFNAFFHLAGRSCQLLNLTPFSLSSTCPITHFTLFILIFLWQSVGHMINFTSQRLIYFKFTMSVLLDTRQSCSNEILEPVLLLLVARLTWKLEHF